MKHEINPHPEGVTVTVRDVSDEQRGLLIQAVRQCQGGRCSCPTEEYRKLEDLEIDTAPDRLRLTLTAKVGERLDPAEIARCLDHTKRRLSRSAR